MSCIVISSSDEEDSVVNTADTSTHSNGRLAKGLLNCSDKENDSQSSNDSVIIMETTPKSDFRVSRKKLQLLRKEWKKMDRQKSSVIICDDSPPPPNKFKIDNTRFKDLRAVVRVELQSSPEKFPGMKINDEKMVNDNLSSGIETPPCSPILPTFELSPVHDNKESAIKKAKTGTDPISPVKKLKQCGRHPTQSYPPVYANKSETTNNKPSIKESKSSVRNMTKPVEDGKCPTARNNLLVDPIENGNPKWRIIKNHSVSAERRLDPTARDDRCPTANNTFLVEPTKNKNPKQKLFKSHSGSPVRKLNQPAKDDKYPTAHNSAMVDPAKNGSTKQKLMKNNSVSPVSKLSQSTINGKLSPSNTVFNRSQTKRPCYKNESISPIKKLKQSPIKAYFSQVDSPPTVPRKDLCKQPLISGSLQVSQSPVNDNSSGSSSSHSSLICVTETKRNELIWPPHHIVQNPSIFIRKCFSKSKTFCTYYMDAIDGLLEEKLFYELVGAVQSFRSSHMAPPPELTWLLVRDVLLASRKKRLGFSVYTLLQEIHNSFPFSCLKMEIGWSHIQELYNSLHTTNSELKLLNTRLALSFLFTVLSTEVKSVALKTKPTRVTKVFSVDFHTQIVKKIITGIRRWIYEGKSNKKDEKGLSRVNNGENQFTMDVYQTLLKFVTVLSCNKEYTPIRIADELMFIYIELDSLDSRRKMLQTLQSSLVRKYLIDVLLMNYCSLLPDAMSGAEHVLSVRKIVYQDFHRNPPRRLSDSGKCWSVVEVEEYVMLLAYLLQDYISNHNEAQSSHSDYTVFKEDRCKWLSHDDYTVLADLKMHISDLWMRCDEFLGGSTMSLRTSLFFEMMEGII